MKQVDIPLSGHHSAGKIQSVSRFPTMTNFICSTVEPEERMQPTAQEASPLFGILLTATKSEERQGPAISAKANSVTGTFDAVKIIVVGEGCQ